MDLSKEKRHKRAKRYFALRGGGLAGELDPKTLFASNEQGLWLDPSDMSAGKAAWRRNLLTYSEQADNANWIKTNATITANQAANPENGELTADLLTATADGGTIVQANTQTAGVVYTQSVWIRSVSGTVSGSIYGSSSFATRTNFTATTSWQRVTNTVVGIGATRFPSIVLDTNGTSILIWGHQVEIGSTPTEYQRITDFSTEFEAAFPTHTLYQDSAAVTPCTAAGDPVGLILDQSRGGLGAKTQYTLTNGSFDSGSTGWTASNATVDASVSGQLTVTGASAGSIGIIQQEITGSVAGQWWEIVADVQVTSSSGVLGFWTGAASSTVPITGTHRQTVRMITLAAGTVQARVGTVNVIGASIIVYDIKVYQVPGNHAYQATSASRPTLARIPSSGRRNLLTRTEEFDNAAWTKNISTIIANSATAPDGTTTADTLTASAQYGNVTQPSTAAGTSFTFSCYAKKVGSFNELEIGLTNANNYINGFAAMFNLNTGAYVSQRTFGTGYTLTTYSITDAGSGWYRLVVSGTISVSAAPVAWCGLGVNSANGSTMLLWGAQLETGSAATNYQKVVATTDVTESGFGDLWHLVFDGSDDSLVTNSISFDTWTQETRRNLLYANDDFGNSFWAKTNGATAVGNAITFVNTNSYVQQNIAVSPNSITLPDPVTVTLKFKASVNSGATSFRTRLADGNDGSPSNTATHSLTTTPTYYTQTATLSGSFSGNLALLINGDSIIAAGSVVTIEELQLEVGSVATTYQRVGTDEMTVIAGVRKLSDSSAACVAELSASYGSNNGSFVLIRDTDSANFQFGSRGTTSIASGAVSAAASPASLVLTGQADISADQVSVRLNGGTPVSSSSDQGSGNYGNYQLFIGRRNQATIPYNGHLYQLIIRGKTTPINQLILAEEYTRTRTPIIAPVIISPPTISGTVELGQTLTATASYAYGNRPITTAWQWLRGGTPISGATSSTYRIRVEDVGSTLTAVQTDTNSDGSYSVASAATVVVPAYTFASLFATNEQGVLYDLSEMTDTKTTWRRNLLTYSERLTTSPWSANEASLESATPPSGIGLAWKLKETGNSGVHFVGRVLNTVLSASVQHTLSVYAKAGERNILSIVGESTATTLCDFDLSAGTAHPAASATGTITSVGDGWYRCSMTWTATASPSTTYFATKQSLAGGLVFTGTLNSGLFLAAAQLERASTPTSYQPITDFSTEFKSAFPAHTLYQDSNGVTPVTQPGDPIGLVIDQRKGGLSALGSELWNHSSVLLVGNSQILSNQVYRLYSSAGSLATVQINSIMVVGRRYCVEFTIDSIATAGSGIVIGDSGATFNTTGRKRAIYLADDVNFFIKRVSGATDYQISNISVRELPGNPAFQTTSASRPTLVRYPVSGRRNLLTYSEQLTNTAEAGSTRPWAVSAGANTVTSNYAQAPDGTNTANRLVFTSSSYPGRQQQIPVSLVAGQSYTFSIWIKRISGSNSGRLEISGGGGTVIAGFQTITGTADWQRVSLTLTAVGSGTASVYVYPEYTVSATGEYLLWGAQLETGSTATTYQRVTSTFDVVEANQASCYGIQFDGSDDSLITNSVDFSGTNKVTLVSGVSKFASSYTPEIVALSSNADINNGSFAFGSGENNSTNWLVSLRGNAALNSYSPRQYPSPTTNLVTALYDISQAVKANEITARINGIVDNGYSIGSESGGGNFGNYPLYLGRRAGTVLPFTGIIWNLVIRGSSTASNTLISTEELASENTPEVTL